MRVSASTAQSSRPPVAKGLSITALVRVYLRCFCAGAAINIRGMRNIGLAYAMEPGLACLWEEPEQRAAARKRYLTHFNTHPFFIPLLVGVFLALESDIRRGYIPAGTLDSVKTTTTNTISAIGDALFSGGILVLWSLSTGLLVATGNWLAAVLLGVCLFVGLHVVLAVSFVVGLTRGFRILPRLAKLRLADIAAWCKSINGALLACFWVVCFWLGSPSEEVLPQWWRVATAACGIGLVASLIWRVPTLREILVAAALVGFLVWPAL